MDTREPGTLVGDMLSRDFPGPSILAALERYREAGTPGCIVELGCMRMPLKHPLERYDPQCCLDGHSTVHFAATDLPFFSCDINRDAVQTSQYHVRAYPNATVFEQDGLEFLAQFHLSLIGFLYLDCWDVDHPKSVIKHRQAFQLALPRMAPQSFILLDDTDVDWSTAHQNFVWSEGLGGKGRLVIPEAQKAGYEIQWTGRQVLLSRTA